MVAFFLEDTARLGLGAERDDCAAVGTVDDVRRLDAPFLGSPLVRIALTLGTKACEVLLINRFPNLGSGSRMRATAKATAKADDAARRVLVPASAAAMKAAMTMAILRFYGNARPGAVCFRHCTGRKPNTQQLAHFGFSAAPKSDTETPKRKLLFSARCPEDPKRAARATESR